MFSIKRLSFPFALLMALTSSLLSAMESHTPQGILKLVNNYDHDLSVSITGPEGLLIPSFYVNDKKVYTEEQEGLIRYSTKQPIRSRLPDFTIPARSTAVINFDEKLAGINLSISYSYTRALQKEDVPYLQKWWARLLLLIGEGKSPEKYMARKEASFWGRTEYRLEADLENTVLLEFDPDWTSITNKPTEKQRQQYALWDKEYKEKNGATDEAKKRQYRQLAEFYELLEKIEEVKAQIATLQRQNRQNEAKGLIEEFERLDKEADNFFADK